MSYSQSEDKTESATPHKIKKLEAYGRTHHLYDLNSFCILLFFFFIILF